MPGVPSGRGCEGCRKQKKKCDQTKPSCSRCARLQMTCVGAGQQRYKFQEEKGFPDPVNKGIVTRKCANPNRDHAVPAIRINPTSKLTLLASLFTNSIKPTTDLRYSLAWSYGVVLDEVPRRLGTNEALDSSARALMAAHSDFCSLRGVTPEALARYSHALITLNVCLDDPAKACTSETLCAVMLLLICQGFQGVQGRRWTGHCEGAAQLLKVRGFKKSNDEFEHKILLMLRGSVLIEGLFNPKIHFTSWEWKTLVENELDGTTHEGQMMRCLARFPDLMKRGRKIHKGQRGYSELLEELSTTHQTLKDILTQLHIRLVPFQELISSGAPQGPGITQIHAHFQRSYGLCLVFCIISSCVLNAVDVEATELVSETKYYSMEILDLAKSAAMYRPLGASYVQLCLIAAWIGSADKSMRSMVDEALVEFHTGWATKQDILPASQMELLSQHLRLLNVYPY